MKSLLSTLILAGSLVFSGCGDKDNKKNKDFVKFIKEEGNLKYDGKNSLYFSRDDKYYLCDYAPSKNVLAISIYGKESDEHFEDVNLDGLDSYFLFNFNDENLVSDVRFQSKENKKKYETLIDSIPKWHSEWSLNMITKKTKEDLSRSQGNYGIRFKKYHYFEDLPSIHKR